MNRGGLFLVPEIAATVTDAEEDLTGFSMYRKHTESLLRYYFKLTLTSARYPSLLVGYSSHSYVSHSRRHTLEDEAILVHDMERAMARELSERDLQLIALRLFEGETFDEIARRRDCFRQQLVQRDYPNAIDRVTRALSEAGLLNIPELAPTIRKPMAKAPRAEREMEAKSAF